MDDTTRKMLLTVGTGVAKKALITLGSIAATHGVIASNETETFVAGGMAVVGLGWSFWNDYGKAIVLSQLEVLKAKSLAQAAKLKQNSIPAVTVAQIADQSPNLSVADVQKTVPTLPPAVQANIQPAGRGGL